MDARLIPHKPASAGFGGLRRDQREQVAAGLRLPTSPEAGIARDSAHALAVDAVVGPRG